MSAPPSPASRGHRLASILPWLAVLATGFYFASYRLADAPWYDEAYALATVLPKGPVAFLTGEYVPNIHALFYVALWGWNHTAGGEVCLLRLLPCLAFLLAALVLVRATNRIAVPAAGAVAGMLFVTHHVALNWSCQLRGYGPSWLPVALGLWALARYEARPRRGFAAVYGLAGAAAVAILPTNFLAFAVLGLWHVALGWLARRRGEPVRIGPRVALAASPVLGLLMYAGLFPGLTEQAVGYDTTYTWSRVVSHWFWATGRDLWWFGLLAGGGVVVLIRTSLQKSAGAPAPGDPRSRLILLGCFFALPLVVLALVPVIPPPRTLLPLLPLGFVAVALAWDALLHAATPSRPGRIAATVALCLVLFGAALLRERVGAGYLDRHAIGDRPQNLYDLYYHHAFRPRLAVEGLRQLAANKPSVVITDNSDLYAINLQAQMVRIEAPLLYHKRVSRDSFIRLAAKRRFLILTRTPERAAEIYAHLRTLAPDRVPAGLRPYQRMTTGYFKIYSLVSPTAPMLR